ncbi:MAG TPA: hypothetical protein VNK04_04005, partial [Gemmataceae bacterium]|nr:hypothetical protein [Gemmataceae bacterium]
PAVGAEGAAVAYGDQETRELMMDLESLFARGWSNERIAAELKLSVKDVAYLRRRFVDTDEAASA